MREIKFRAWDKQKKIMFYVRNLLSKLGLSCSEWKLFGNGVREYTNAEDCILMQFTGLKDKNNKEIYEGDIVKGQSYLYGYDLKGTEQFNFSGVIIWQNQGDTGMCYQVENKDGDAWDLNNCVHRNELYLNGEVIGNIYENPKLLK